MAAIILIFLFGYLAITLEHSLRINKAATALLTGVLCWVIYSLNAPDREGAVAELAHHLGDLSQILFFLIGAMTIVELIDAHDGFEIITKQIRTRNKRKLVWIIGFITFFLSAILDNLTTAIVLVTLIRKLMPNKNDRLLFCGITVVAANAGGAWSPIGDVTTTMLWIGGQVTAYGIITKLMLPSLVALIVPLFLIQFMLHGDLLSHKETDKPGVETPPRQRAIVFFSGVGILVLVPVFKTVTHLPPFMGMLLGLGLLWVIVELLNSEKDEEFREQYTVAYALRKIDVPSILFFLGILLAVAALQSAHYLSDVAQWMAVHIKNEKLIVLTIGLLSAIVDNVPLVAATQAMYGLQQFPTDHSFWLFMAYATGTGGSVLIIGTAAGVAAMGIEKIKFMWYLKRISWVALAGFIAGAGVYLLLT